MKIKSFLTLCTLSAVVLFSSCKKENTEDETEVETTFELSANEGMSENLTQDANEVLNEAAVDFNFQGSSFTGGVAQTSGITSCANVTVTPRDGFPKTIVIDFGVAGCSSPRGINRRGIIRVVITDSLRRPGSRATMTFDNYFVGGFKKEGTITWTNTSTSTIKSWSRVTQNGKITAPNGNFWLHFGTQNVVLTAGSATPLNLLDDIYSITGTRTITNPAGRTRTGTVLTALQKKAICDNVDQGTYQVQGPNHIAVIDYGNGECNNLATISINGRPARTIILR